MKIPKDHGTGIYLIVCKKNGKIYVGSSYNSFYNRFHNHRSSLRRGVHYNTHLQNTWNKYGEKSFEFVIHERCKPEKVLKREQFWIDKLVVTDRSIGFNLSLTAEACMTGRNHTAESKAKMSANRKGRDNSKATEAAAKVNRGRKRPMKEETKIKLSISLTLAHQKPEVKKKHKETHWSNRPDADEITARINAKNTGRKLSEEHKANISEGNRRRWERFRQEQNLN